MPFEMPPVIRLTERLLTDIEQVVIGFQRQHKYVLGADLRSGAMRLWKLANRAWRDRANRPSWLDKLVWAVDDFKAVLQLGKRVKAFKSFRQFEQIVTVCDDLGRQVGGWKKQSEQHPKGQSVTTPPRAAQRPQILSTRAASREATR